jgi:hypothetical protein
MTVAGHLRRCLCWLLVPLVHACFHHQHHTPTLINPTPRQDDATPLDVMLIAEVAPHLMTLMEVAPGLRAALEAAHPAAPLAEPAGPGQRPDSTQQQAAAVAAASILASLPDGALLLFEISDPGGSGNPRKSGPSSRSLAPKPLAPVHQGRPRRAGAAAGPGAAGQPASAPPAAPKRARKRARPGAEAAAAPEQSESAQAATAALEEEAEVAHGGGFIREEPPAAAQGQGTDHAAAEAATAQQPQAPEDRLPRPQLIGKRALGRRKQAFRRALAFAVLLIHRRFSAQLAAGVTGGGARWMAAGEAAAAPAPAPAAGRRAAAARQQSARKPAAGQQGTPAAASTAGARRSSRAAALTARQRVQQQLSTAHGGAGEAVDEEEEERAVRDSGEEEPPPPKKRRRNSAAAGASQQQVGDSTSGRGDPAADGVEDNQAQWDPLDRGRWHPQFDPDLITTGELRAALAEHARWLAGQLKIEVDGRGADDAGDSRPRPAAPPRVVKRHERCTDTTALDPRAFIGHLRSLPWYDDQLAHQREVAARPALKALPAAVLSRPTLAALASRGIDVAGLERATAAREAALGLRGGGGGSSGGATGAQAAASDGSGLFIHQAAAIDALLLRGSHTVVCTSTASGKSVCYNVPVLEALAADPQACALYMFPTKALAQDQLVALRGMVAAAFGPQAASLVEVRAVSQACCSVAWHQITRTHRRTRQHPRTKPDL